MQSILLTWTAFDQGKNPRVFSLQKIVESATVNMGRVRLVWGKIWEILREHFTAVGCHDNTAIAQFAIDSLRQLAYKFLEKDELSNFNFQSEFLVPFEHIAASSKSVSIRELVVRCIEQMIQARTDNLKSGWKSALNVLQIAAAAEADDGPSSGAPVGSWCGAAAGQHDAAPSAVRPPSPVPLWSPLRRRRLSVATCGLRAGVRSCRRH